MFSPTAAQEGNGRSPTFPAPRQRRNVRWGEDRRAAVRSCEIRTFGGFIYGTRRKKLGVVKLTFFAIGTTLATGVFSISGDFAAAGAHAGAVLIGWGICLVGMLGLTMYCQS